MIEAFKRQQAGAGIGKSLDGVVGTSALYGAVEGVVLCLGEQASGGQVGAEVGGNLTEVAGIGEVFVDGFVAGVAGSIVAFLGNAVTLRGAI